MKNKDSSQGSLFPVGKGRVRTSCEKPLQVLVQRLFGLIDREGEWPSVIPNLTFHRFDHPTKPTGYLLEPSICLILQGSKHVVLGERQYTYGPGHFFVTSIDLPVIARILEASPSIPFLGMVLRLDRMEVARLVMESPLPPMKEVSDDEVIEFGEIARSLLEAIVRLVDLLAEPELIPVLSPLMQREILCRFLLTPCGPKIRQIAVGGNPTHQISKVIDWIKRHLTEKLRVEDLAIRSGMSVSTLHHHFRSLTSLSPLQFQKRLRLNEARYLMLEHRMDVASAAFKVGYESPSQFSREYSRLFGAPPLRDIRNLAD